METSNNFVALIKKHTQLAVIIFLVFVIFITIVLLVQSREETAHSIAVPNSYYTTPEELLIPPNTQDSAAVAAYSEAVEEFAVPADTIVVTEKCTMSPLVIKLPENSTLRIENQDSVPHTIAFEDQNFFTVSAGKTREINVLEVFKKPAGVYRYRCNDLSTSANVGVMYIVAE